MWFKTSTASRGPRDGFVSCDREKHDAKEQQFTRLEFDPVLDVIRCSLLTSHCGR